MKSREQCISSRANKQLIRRFDGCKGLKYLLEIKKAKETGSVVIEREKWIKVLMSG